MAESQADASSKAPAGSSGTDPPLPQTTAAATQPVEDAPDPDDDDLDDLDDMLDEFSSTHDVPVPEQAAKSVPNSDSKPLSAVQDPLAALNNELSPEDFANMLQKEMESLMQETEDNPEFKASMEALVQEGLKAEGLVDKDGATGSQDPPKAAGKAAEESFQETIRKTMERMQASGDEAGAAAAKAGVPDLGLPGKEGELLAQLMQELSAEGGGAGGEGDDEFSKMLLGMMEQLTNKEILYEPMKDLHTRFPEWMENNKEKVDAGDMQRYKEQQKLVGEIVGRFEQKGYTDDNAKDREFIVERMQQMQSQGNPPAELVGDLKETQDALGDLDAGCPQQ